MKQFGAKVSTELEKRYEQSPNWKDGKFENLEETSMNFTVWDVPKMLYNQLFNNDGMAPEKPLPIMDFNKKAFLKDDVPFKFIWFGHSVILMRLNGKTILIDPMLGPDAAPISPTKNKRFSENTLDIIDNFPPIDLMVLTHDH
ncbi:MAG: MBL fold metallo-hydrolase, partial [Flavobacteriales bacterium]